MVTLTQTKQKELLYVTVYDKLFKMITEGTFEENSRLPSEPELAKRLGISRSTLRQSLSLLQDDGLIKNIRGKGNFITKKTNYHKKGLEKIGHPVYRCLDVEPTELEIDFKINPPSEYYKKVLGNNSSATLCIDRWYLDNNKILAYSYTIIPIEAISLFNVNLNEDSSIKKFIEENIYSDCTTVNVSVKFTTAGNFVTKNHPILNEDNFFLIEEGIYNNSQFPIAFNKHYLPVKNSTININQTK